MRLFQKLLFAVSASALLFGIASAAEAPTIVTPSSIHWQAGTGPLKGTQVAVLAGDPSKAGLYIVRVRVPSGLVFAPHFHREAENVTVLQGMLMVGLGNTVVKSKMTALPAGSFVMVPPNVHHYAMAKGLTIIEITGMGPRTMIPLKP
jgi:quercetin dioxygenase-like cupin family protein